MSGVKPSDNVLEIGPGQGDLTSFLLDAQCRVLAVEIDSKLVPSLNQRFKGSPAFTLLEGDALDGKHGLNPKLLALLDPLRPYRLVSNLPYAAGTPLLVNLLTGSQPPERSVVMLQYEVALRLTAGKGHKSYGALSVQMANVATCRILQKVSPACFTPPPKVESALVELVRAPCQADPVRLRSLLTLLFGQRRKSVGKKLLSIGINPSDFGIDPRSRAEDLDPATFFALSNHV